MKEVIATWRQIAARIGCSQKGMLKMLGSVVDLEGKEELVTKTD